MIGAGPWVLSIRHFALDDGPGIRTTLFFKGCPLACVWCHNPEAIFDGPAIRFHPRLCIGCASCAAVCREGAIRLGSPSRIDRAACTVCGECVEVCPATALRVAGTAYTPAELVRLLLRDRPFYDASCGGVTFSGGEPTLHAEYLGQVLRLLREKAIHTAIQTCGMFDPVAFAEHVLPYTDRIYFDLKLLDTAAHLKYTGRPNTAILRNFRQLTKTAREKIVPRVPLVPGITATRKNLREIAEFLRALGYSRCELLPYNPGGIDKRIAAGMTVPLELIEGLSDRAEQAQTQEVFELCKSTFTTPSPT